MSLHRLAMVSLFALAAAASSTPIAAQSVAQDSISPAVPTAAPIAPTPSIQVANGASVDRARFLAPAPTRVDVRRQVGTTTALAGVESSDSRSPAMMIVGGAGLIVGALVGGQAGTIIMVGGGIVGLFGLWNYLK